MNILWFEVVSFNYDIYDFLYIYHINLVKLTLFFPASDLLK